MPEQTLAAPAVEELARSFGGALLQPGDEGFDEARLVWNGIHDRHPALIARCTTPDDVVAAVNFARDARPDGRRARRRPLRAGLRHVRRRRS